MSAIQPPTHCSQPTSKSSRKPSPITPWKLVPRFLNAHGHLKNLFICRYLVILGLHCYMRAFSSCDDQGLLFSAMPRLLIAVASLVVGHRLWSRVSSCGAQALAALQHLESSWARDQTQFPCIGRGILTHWTTREVPPQDSQE